MPLQNHCWLQMGDEAKVDVDWFASHADINVRYNAADNAGHTVTVGPRIFKLHLLHPVSSTRR